MSQKEKLSFEEAFERLEKILEQMSSNQVSLEQSLQLFEEANSLMTLCDKTLSEAQQKVESLIKNRNGDLTLENQKPLTEPFSPGSKSVFVDEK